MFFRVLATTIATFDAAVATPLAAQHADHSGHAGHVMAVPGASDVPSEPGDGSFAAIIEIVAMLSADPDTDWTRVDIDGLREHLVDMNQLIVGASVRSEPLPDGLRMRIGTSGRPGVAASRMVPAHAPFLSNETGWRSEVVSDGDEIVWTVTAADTGAVARIQALGFFGLIATGDHHRMHHMAMASGEAAH
ncbi:hypothetical protein [Jannaschia ovalis]|uniref:Polyketide cyclase / dehydrase and lipid transport n=1 Tax=Jannaschia ovalis TaxID=3038773 RepID=A0ABY8LBD8_9RHOB|nr:hypothetical protein [Jannaschia sp. GRR-S6-38]WGH78604.1 hypothetical protein P8627_16565 [Jannaschia sp. GRR-S6-38]